MSARSSSGRPALAKAASHGASFASDCTRISPDALFSRIASRMLAIDPIARSSTWDDLAAGRLTEVDYINGEVVKLAQAQGRNAPINATLCELIHEAERTPSRWTAEKLLAALA
jgi:2-dehydropantoate 2-reductase